MKPENILCISSFFSAWGDRMWSFAVGLYLIKLTPGSLQLTAIYGLVLTSVAVLFAPVVGDWVDRKARLKVVRTTLLLQNILVIFCALFILIYLYKITGGSHYQKLLQAIIIVLGSSANLAGQGEKISVTKDWIVVVCKDNKDLLADSNALLRRIDLTVAILAPVAVGLLMTTISDTAGIIFICSWNVLSMIAEYLLLLKVYNTTPELAIKQEDDTDVKVPSQITNKNAESANEQEDMQLLLKSQKKRSNLNFLYRFKCIVLGWGVYRRQNVVLAGMSLAMLFLTVLGFNAITTGYAYSQGLSELYVSICFGAGSLVGIGGTFLFPRIRKKVGLKQTGLFGSAIQLSMLMSCVASIWAPGSPSNLQSNSKFNHSIYRNVTLSIVQPEYSAASTVLPASVTNPTVNTTVTPISNGTNPHKHNTNTTMQKQKSPISIILLMVGVVLSRAGLWISDLTITQLQQENVPEEERGTVGGIQYAFNSILDLIHFIVTICLPKPEQFGILILMSVGAVTVAAIIYVVFCLRFKATASHRNEYVNT